MSTEEVNNLVGLVAKYESKTTDYRVQTIQ